MKSWFLTKRWTVIIAGILIVAVPLIGLSLFIRWQTTAALEERLDKETQWLSSTAALHLSEALNGNINLGNLFVTRITLLDGIKKNDRTIMTRHLKLLVNTVPSLDRAFITTDKGIQIANYPETPATLGKDFSDRDWYRGVSNNWAPYVSEFYVRAAEPKRYLFAIAVPVKIDGAVSAILVLQPKADYLRNILTRLEIGRGRIFAVDRSGRLIYHPDHILDKIIDYSTYPVVQNVMKGQSGIMKTVEPSTNARFYSSYSFLEEWGWGVIVEKPEEVVLEPVRRISYWIMLFTGLMLMLGGYFAFRGAELLVSTQQLSARLQEDEQVEKAYNEVLVMLNNTWPSLTELCNASLARLIEQTCAEAGVLYTMEDSGFSPCSAVGIPLPEAADSLALECLKQKKTMRIKDIPSEALLEMETLAGSLRPRDIVAIPLLYKNVSVGAIELACLHGFSERDVRMLDHIAPQLAIGINTIRSQIALKDLSDELSCSNEELKSMNEELQTMNEELQTQQQELGDANRKIQEVSKAKSDFLANMSHELRTPLNSVIGFSEVLQDQLFGPLNDKQKEYITDILDSGRHLLDLINDILDLSKVEAGKLELEPGTFPLKEALNTAMSMFREKAMKHNLRMTLDPGPDDELEIEADERKVKQIMFNLLSNAVKFTPDGGSVHVSVRRVDRDLGLGVGREKPAPIPQPPVPDRDFIEISVTDTGIGIRPEDLPKLFHEFTQLGSAYTKEYAGTGRGLALTTKLVEVHHGSIRVESEFGKGSTFIFTLPLRQVMSEQRVDSEGRVGSDVHSGRKIAVVIEDDPKALSMVEGSLKSEGYQVFASRSGAEGLHTVRRELPGLVVLDLMMPGINGFEVIDALKAEKHTAGIPIVVLTAMDLSDETRRKLRSKVNAIAEKGRLTMDEFAEIAKKASGGA